MHLKIDFSKAALVIDEQEASIKDLYQLEQADWKKYILQFLLDWQSPQEHINIYTSGSTGHPKKITLLKTDMLASASATNHHFNIVSGANYFLCLSPTYIAGMMMIVRAIENKGVLIAVAPSNKPLANYSNETLHFAVMVPSQFYNSIEALKTMKIDQLILGGSPLNEKVLNQLKDISTKIYLTYGMTESITHIAAKEVWPQYNSHFTTLKDVEISKDDRDCLIVEPKYLSVGKLITNDIVKLISTTEFEWLGRFDNVINSGGVKIHPEKLEKELSTFIDIPFIIYSEPHPQFGEQVCLLLECNSKDLDHYKSILESNKSTLEKYEFPKLINCLPQFKRTDSGKIQRNQTAALLKK